MNTLTLFAQTSSSDSSVPAIFAGGIGLIFLLILAALWFIFPFMVYLKFNELIQATKRNLEVLEEIERSTRRPMEDKTSSAVRYSIDEPTSSPVGVIFGSIAVVILIVLVVALVRRQ